MVECVGESEWWDVWVRVEYEVVDVKMCFCVEYIVALGASECVLPSPPLYRPEFVSVMLACCNHFTRNIYETKPLPRGVRRPIHSASRCVQCRGDVSLHMFQLTTSPAKLVRSPLGHSAILPSV